METFVFAFGLMLLIVIGMSLGVMLMGKRIKGSCGGLNAISDADHCVVCNKEIDPNSPLKERLQCPRARKMMAQMEADAHKA
ncbi:MAG: (Na+)-NQR maturation NqrM [Dinoroseobacter sp.]|nr:(Na+)-NQR maturation NqrM [Dinoroseobacter sp.]